MIVLPSIQNDKTTIFVVSIKYDIIAALAMILMRLVIEVRHKVIRNSIETQVVVVVSREHIVTHGDAPSQQHSIALKHI